MILTFKSKETEKLASTGESRMFKSIERVALRKLDIIDAAISLEVLRCPPGNRLEVLRGDREGQHSIRINDQWRICFRWENGHAYDVEIVDYHS